MIYACSFCKTGAMNTSEQYLAHINGTKHKKKVFQLQAPDDGIEYDEFIVKTQYRTETNVSNGPEYNNISEKYKSSSRPIVVYDDFPINEVVSRKHKSVTIDDIFFKKDSKIESTKYIVDSFLKSKKTAAQALNEIATAMIWELEMKPVSPRNLKYAMVVLIDGIEFAIGEGDNKRESKQNAAAEAVRAIKMKIKRIRDEANDNPKSNKTEKRKSNESLADSYQKVTIGKKKELERDTKNQFVMPKRYAAFIITESYDQPARDGTIVAFGAGKGVNSRVKNDTAYPGYRLENYDSLVLAKRSLQCFFYNQILLLFDDRSNECRQKLYFKMSRNGFIKFKYGCRLHLYMSHAPYGDCVKSLPPSWKEPTKLTNKEIERDRNGIMEPVMYMSYSQIIPLKKPGHIRVLNNGSTDEWISLVNYKYQNKHARNVTLSPTDKLMAWIHLGIQGAMLSHLMDPVYLYSIQFGMDYIHEHVTRALICRVSLDNLINNRGSYYDSVKFYDPYFDRVSEIHEDSYEFDTYESTRVCFNWYLNRITKYAEVVDTRTGCVHPNSLFHLPNGEESNKCSRLSKVCMLIRFRKCIRSAIDYFDTRQEFQRARFLQSIIEDDNYNIHGIKYFATDYRKLKQCLFESLSAKHYGEWFPNIAAKDINLINYYEL